MAKETENSFELAEALIGRKLTPTEQIILDFLARNKWSSTGEDLFIQLHNTGAPVSYPTVYVTLRRLAGAGILQKEYNPETRKVFYRLNS